MLNPALIRHQAFSNTGLQAGDYQHIDISRFNGLQATAKEMRKAVKNGFGPPPVWVTGLKAGVNQKHEEACPSFIRFR
jgi:hypothetical protein